MKGIAPGWPVQKYTAVFSLDCPRSPILATPLVSYKTGGAGGLEAKGQDWRAEAMGWQGLTSRAGKKWHPIPLTKQNKDVLVREVSVHNGRSVHVEEAETAHNRNANFQLLLATQLVRCRYCRRV